MKMPIYKKGHTQNMPKNQISKLKLYVWENVLCDHTCGIMFALAHSIKEARKLIETKPPRFKGCDRWIRQDLQEKPKIVSKPEAFMIWGSG